MNYYDKDGRAMSFGDWVASFENPDCWGVLDDTVAGVCVSTVWLGIDHRHSGDGPPLIFETMVFGGDFDQSCWRHSTIMDAYRFHDRVTALLRLGKSLEELRA